MRDEIYQSLNDLESELNNLKKVKDFYDILQRTGENLIKEFTIKANAESNRLNDIHDKNDLFINQNTTLINQTLERFQNTINVQSEKIANDLSLYSNLNKEIDISQSTLDLNFKEKVNNLNEQLQKVLEDMVVQYNEQLHLYEKKHESIIADYKRTFQNYQSTLIDLEKGLLNYKEGIESIDTSINSIKTEIFTNRDNISSCLKKLDGIEDKLDNLSINLNQSVHQEGDEIKNKLKSLGYKMDDLLNLIKVNINWPWRKIK